MTTILIACAWIAAGLFVARIAGMNRDSHAHADEFIAASEYMSDSGLDPLRIRADALDPLDFERVEI